MLCKFYDLMSSPNFSLEESSLWRQGGMDFRKPCSSRMGERERGGSGEREREKPRQESEQSVENCLTYDWTLSYTRLLIRKWKTSRKFVLNFLSLWMKLTQWQWYGLSLTLQNLLPGPVWAAHGLAPGNCGGPFPSRMPLSPPGFLSIPPLMPLPTSLLKCHIIRRTFFPGHFI